MDTRKIILGLVFSNNFSRPVLDCQSSYDEPIIFFVKAIPLQVMLPTRHRAHTP